jgi:NAD(P)-dependent dehydrogenase (short-subunit alcohol dehydrogenase family)
MKLKKRYNTDVLDFGSDITNYQEQVNVVDQIINKWDSLDVLVANAGVGHFRPVDELTLEEWNRTIDTNLTGVFYSVKSAVEYIKKSKGYIITIASLAGTNFFESGSAYNASKFGLVGFTQAMMLDLRKYDVKVTTIMPGSVATYFNNHIPNEQDSWKIQPEDLGQMVVDLIKMNPRTLPSKIEVRPSFPHKKNS